MAHIERPSWLTEIPAAPAQPPEPQPRNDAKPRKWGLICTIVAVAAVVFVALAATLSGGHHQNNRPAVLIENKRTTFQDCSSWKFRNARLHRQMGNLESQAKLTKAQLTHRLEVANRYPYEYDDMRKYQITNHIVWQNYIIKIEDAKNDLTRHQTRYGTQKNDLQSSINAHARKKPEGCV